jgi:hypothetical protein
MCVWSVKQTNTQVDTHTHTHAHTYIHSHTHTHMCLPLLESSLKHIRPHKHTGHHTAHKSSLIRPADTRTQIDKDDNECNHEDRIDIGSVSGMR